jgi:hypothetical protein
MAVFLTHNLAHALIEEPRRSAFERRVNRRPRDAQHA